MRFMNTAYNIVISPNFLVWKLCGNSTFPHHFHIRKLGEITIFYAVNADDDTRYVLPTTHTHSANGRSSGRCFTSAIPSNAMITSNKTAIGYKFLALHHLAYVIRFTSSVMPTGQSYKFLLLFQ